MEEPLPPFKSHDSARPRTSRSCSSPCPQVQTASLFFLDSSICLSLGTGVMLIKEEPSPSPLH